MGKKPFTKKERVLSAVNLEQPDRVPLDFSANTATLSRLYKDLNVETYRELLETFHIDILDLRGSIDPHYQGPVPKERMLKGGIKENYWGWRTKTMDTEAGKEDCFVDFILSDCQTIKEMEQHQWPSVDWFDFSDFAERLEPWHEYAIMASGASIWQHLSFLRGIENLLLDLLANPELANYILDKFTDFYVAYFDKMFQSAPGKIDILRVADDLGTQHGLLFSMDHFEAFIAPRLKKIIDMAHSHNVRLMFHSCGSIIPTIEPLIKLGIDILDPLQVSADNMDPHFIKDQFGSRLCLHGSMDTQFLLPKGTPEEVRYKARSMIDILGKGGGFILSPSHVLQTDVPTENIKALYEEGFKFLPEYR